MNKILKYINTIKFLKFIQIFYLIKVHLNLNKKKIYPPNYKKFNKLKYNNTTRNFNSLNENYVFDFLNLKKDFNGKVDWNFKNYGKLWNYNLNYFDFLNYDKVNLNFSINLTKDFLNNYQNIKYGRDPYPTSLRIFNIIKFCSKNNLFEKEFIDLIYMDTKLLMDNIEYHLLGNHLLENAFSIYLSGLFFEIEKFKETGKKIIVNQLKKQILSDGAHYELSHMYHKIILFKILDLLNFHKSNPKIQDDIFVNFLKSNAERMISWSNSFSLKNGYSPNFNDSYRNNLNLSDLRKYQKFLEIPKINLGLGESGFRKIVKKNYSIFLDIGNIVANHQPGHSHADNLNFELLVGDIPVIVDTGISTYESGSTRDYQRSTEAHNTVTINGNSSSQMWDVFKVAKRATTKIINQNPNYIYCKHNGFKDLNVFHYRSWDFKEKKIIIKDELKGNISNLANSFFHLHPNVKIKKITEYKFNFGLCNIEFLGDIDEVKLLDYNHAADFNVLNKSVCISVAFTKKIKTIIKF